MLPSHSNAGELLNIVTNRTEYIDNKSDTSDDDDEESPNCHENQWPASINSRTKRNKAISSVMTSSSTMTVAPKGESLAARRPLALSLKPIITKSLTKNGEESNLNSDEGKETSETDGRTRTDTHKRITIGFNNIKYSCRGRLFWRRGKFW